MVGCPYMDSHAGNCWEGCADALDRGEWRICCKDPRTEEIRLRNLEIYEERFGKEA